MAERSLWQYRARKFVCRLIGHRWDESNAQLDWCRRCGSGRLGAAYRAAFAAFANGTWRYL